MKMTTIKEQEILSEQRNIEEMQEIVNNKINSLNSMIAKYVEVQNDKDNSGTTKK